MSSIKKSSQQSQNSSNSQDVTKSLIVYGVSPELKDDELLADLKKTYSTVQNVTRMYDSFGEALASILVDFESEAQPMKILNIQYILIKGKQYKKFRAYRPLICRRCQNEGHYASECPQQPVTMERCMELLDDHTAEIRDMMEDFERRWNARLSSLPAATTNNTVAQLVPIFRDLKTTCQQFSQQNIHLQQQLNSIVNRAESLQVKPTNGHA